MGRIFGTVAIVLLIVIFLGLGWYGIQHFLSKDYSQQPPEQTFATVMGKPVPSGVTSVVAAGHAFLHTNMVWLKFEGKPKVLIGLTANMSPVKQSEFHYSSPSDLQGELGSDAEAAGWSDVPNLKNPLYFLFQSHASDGMWVGTMVVSPSTHTAYVSAQHQ